MADFGISESALLIGAAVASTATTAAGAIISYQQQQAQADQTDAYNKQQAANINQARINNYDQAQEQLAYKNTDAAQQQEDMTMKTRAALATSLTSAGENGVSGNSVNALANEYYGRQANFNSDIDYNRNADDNQIALTEQSFNTNAQSQLNQLQPAQQPTILSPILSIGGAAANATTQYERINADTRKNPSA
jgi:hypothetical protein